MLFGVPAHTDITPRKKSKISTIDGVACAIGDAIFFFMLSTSIELAHKHTEYLNTLSRRFSLLALQATNTLIPCIRAGYIKEILRFSFEFSAFEHFSQCKRCDM